MTAACYENRMKKKMKWRKGLSKRDEKIDKLMLNQMKQYK